MAFPDICGSFHHYDGVDDDRTGVPLAARPPPSPLASVTVERNRPQRSEGSHGE
jgi:hypothetical protein